MEYDFSKDLEDSLGLDDESDEEPDETESVNEPSDKSQQIADGVESTDETQVDADPSTDTTQDVSDETETIDESGVADVEVSDMFGSDTTPDSPSQNETPEPTSDSENVYQSGSLDAIGRRLGSSENR